uniref:CCHC-type domain-containing protein n=1 Tax=Tanacetum cinerariifolium TaxID=118510 RepID=A0A6L2JV61_TANCI|nr:hypothetical protein [Tanacetum cinerariifolium]
MEAGSKDRPPMLAPGNYVQWKSRIKRYIDTKPNHDLIHYCLENPPYNLDLQDIQVPVSEGSPITTTERILKTYKNVSQDIRDQLNAGAEEFGKFTSRDGESLESYYSRFYKMMNELIRNQCKVTNHQVNVQFLLQLQPEWQKFVTLVKQNQELKTVSYHKLSQQAATRNRGKAIVNSPQPIYDQKPSMVAEDDETSKDKEIDKLMALISLSFKKIYKPTNNNLQTSSNTSRENQDNSPRINRSAGYENQRNSNVAGARKTVGSSVVQKSGIQCYNYKEFGHIAKECQKPKREKDAAYHREKTLLCKQEEAGIQLNAEQANWRDDTDDDELEDQELEVHYMYMAQLQEVSPDAADSGPIFDDELLQKVSNNDHYNMFAMKSIHPEQSKPVHDTYLIEQDAQNVIIDSLDMSYDRAEIDQNDDDTDLAKERELLASLIEKLKCEIDENKNRNKFLETSNKSLIEILKGKIEDFKNKNKSLESSNNFFKEANNRLSETNNLLYADYKKSESELAKHNSKEYASQMELECVKVRELKDKLSAHQETISILSKQKEAQIKLYKTQEDKELDKVIELENKVKVLDNIVYKTGQSVQTMNMLNNKCQMSFAKPEFLKKAQRANHRLYDIDEVTNLQCNYLELLEKCEGLEIELSKSKMMSKSFESVQKHAINLELELQQCKEKIKNDMLFKDLKAQLQDKSIVLSELKKLIEKLKGKSVDTKFFKPSVIRQPNAFKRVIPTTSVSRPQLKGNPQGDRVMHNNSQGKKQEVEDQRRSVKLPKNKTSVTEYSLSSSSNLKEQEIKQLEMQINTSKENSLNKLNALQSTIQHLSSSNYSMYNKFRDAFHRLFEADERTFKTVLSRNMQNLERKLNKEKLHEKDLNSDLQSVKKSIDERAQHKKEYNSWVNERQMQTTEEKVDTTKALDASSVDTESSRTESKEQDTSSRSGNDAHGDGVDIRPIYDEEPMAKVQTTAEINVFAIGQQHTEQLELNNE